MKSLTYFGKSCTKLALTLFLSLAVATSLDCAARRMQSTSPAGSGASSPPMSPTVNQPDAPKINANTDAPHNTAPLVIQTGGPPDALLGCADGATRNAFGNCPARPICAKRCYLNLNPANPKDCTHHLDYEAQKKDGVQCAYTFPPGKIN